MNGGGVFAGICVAVVAFIALGMGIYNVFSENSPYERDPGRNYAWELYKQDFAEMFDLYKADIEANKKLSWYTIKTDQENLSKSVYAGYRYINKDFFFYSPQAFNGLEVSDQYKYMIKLKLELKGATQQAFGGCQGATI